MTSPNRIRGILAARADSRTGDINATLMELNSVFATFRSNNDERVMSLETTINGLCETVQALRLGGGGDASSVAINHAAPRFNPLNGEVAASFRDLLRDRPSASMTTQSNPDGGYTVIPQVDGNIEAILREISPLRGLARVVSQTSGTGSWEKIIARAGSQSAWVGEEEQRDDLDNPTLGRVTITPQEVYALPELTNTLLDDAAFDLNAFLAEDVSGEFALVEGQAFISGNGMKKPRGFLSYDVATTADAARDFGVLQYVASGHASAFPTSNPADALHDLMTALRPSYRKGAGVAWLMNSATANTVRKWKDGQGNYLWTSSIILGQPDRLLGYPVALDEGMPDISANAFPIAFGNWQRGYAIVDKPGLRVIADRVTKKGWTKLYFYKRVGGGVVDSNAIKLLKIAAT